MLQPPRLPGDEEGAQAASTASKEAQGNASSAGQLGWVALHPKTHLDWVQGQTPRQTLLERQVQRRTAARAGS